jgi:hypothetical protein
MSDKSICELCKLEIEWGQNTAPGVSGDPVHLVCWFQERRLQRQNASSHTTPN